MSVNYYAQSNQPVRKAVFGDTPTTTFAVWTPATGKSIVLTDLSFTAAFAGTVKFFIGTSVTGPDSLLEFIQAGSVLVRMELDTPIVGTADQIIYCGTHTNGRLSVMANGFEQD